MEKQHMPPHKQESGIDIHLKETSTEILKPIFPDYTDDQLILAGERISDFLEYAYMLCKDDLNCQRTENKKL